VRFADLPRDAVLTTAQVGEWLQAAEFAGRNALLTRLWNKGRLDLLRAIKGGTYTVTEVYAADREDHLHELTGERAILGRSLWKAVEDWIGRPLWGEAEKWDGAVPGPTRRRYAVGFKALRARTPGAFSARPGQERDGIPLVAVNW